MEEDEEEEDSDNDHEDDEDKRQPSKGKKTKPVAKSKSNSDRNTRSSSKKNVGGKKQQRNILDLVPWNFGGNNKNGGSGGNRNNKLNGISVGLRNRLEEIAKSGQAAYKDVYRRAKVKFV